MSLCVYVHAHAFRCPQKPAWAWVTWLELQLVVSQPMWVLGIKFRPWESSGSPFNLNKLSSTQLTYFWDWVLLCSSGYLRLSCLMFHCWDDSCALAHWPSMLCLLTIFFSASHIYRKTSLSNYKIPESSKTKNILCVLKIPLPAKSTIYLIDIPYHTFTLIVIDTEAIHDNGFNQAWITVSSNRDMSFLPKHLCFYSSVHLSAPQSFQEGSSPSSCPSLPRLGDYTGVPSHISLICFLQGEPWKGLDLDWFFIRWHHVAVS